MPFKKIVSLCIMLAVSGSFAKGAESGEKGNGGGAIVCRDVNGQIQSAELLDLWEGRVIDKIEPLFSTSASSVSVESYIDIALKKIARLAGPDYAAKITASLAIVKADQKDVASDGVAIMPPRDAENVFIKKGCALEGVAAFIDRKETLYLDEEIFNHFSPADKAALYVHEALYRVLRKEAGATDSLRTRKLTAYLFSSLELPSPKAGLSPDATRCATADQSTVFYLQPNGDLQFLAINNQRLLAKTTVSYVPVRLQWIARGYGSNDLNWYHSNYLSLYTSEKTPGEFSFETSSLIEPQQSSSIFLGLRFCRTWYPSHPLKQCTLNLKVMSSFEEAIGRGKYLECVNPLTPKPARSGS